MITTYLLAMPHGITLHCRAAGNAGRPTLVFLHGFPEAAFVWDATLAHFAAQGFRCIAPNLRGFERSSSPADASQYRSKHLVQDIAALIALEGGPQIECLVAHDWGGAVAWNLAASQPQLIQKLAIINSPHPGTFLRELQHSPAQQAASAYMNFLIRPDAEKLLAEDDFRRLFEFFMPFSTVQGANSDSLGPRKPSRTRPPWLTDAVKAQYRDVWQRGLTGPLNFYRASPLRPGPEIAKLVIPRALLDVQLRTLVMWGLGDIALPPGLLDRLDAFVPRMELQRIEGATHWIIHEQPALVAQHLQRFLAS